jgi:uncharacterized membrane protein YkoI
MKRHLLLAAIAVTALAAGASFTTAAPGAPQEKEAREQEKRVRMRDLPAAVQQTVREQSRGATVRGLSRETEDGKTNYEVELRTGGHNKDVLIDPSGAVVEVEEQVNYHALKG